MPSTRKQMRAAGRELRLRREGKAQKEQERDVRPFGAMSDENLRKYAQHPIPKQQREAAAYEQFLRSVGGDKAAEPNRAFGKASQRDVEFFATASDEQIRARNKEKLR